MAISRTQFRVADGGKLTPIGSSPTGSQRTAGRQLGVHLVVLSGEVEIARDCLREELRNTGRASAQDRQALRETLDTHRRLGAAYGYPSCCVEAFCDAHVETLLSRHHRGHGWGSTSAEPLGAGGQAAATNPLSSIATWGDNGLAIARAAARTHTFDPRLASLPGALGSGAASTLRHLPCRFDCADSRAIAGRLLNDLQGADPRRYRRMAAGLPAPVWVDGHGQASVASAAERRGDRWQVTLRGGEVVHAPLLPAPGRPLLPLLLPFHGSHTSS